MFEQSNNAELTLYGRLRSAPAQTYSHAPAFEKKVSGSCISQPTALSKDERSTRIVPMPVPTPPSLEQSALGSAIKMYPACPSDLIVRWQRSATDGAFMRLR